MDLKDGHVLAGKYRIERVLGQGGMGVVVAATHLQLGERVALKFLLPEALGNPEAVERFAREARAAVRIKSEHVARVSDVGTLDNGAPYMVMEYLAGEDLAAWLLQRGPLAIDQAVEFLLQACEAIAEAHALGIVHRDLKPANLFVIQRADGVLAVKVLDFGISKSTDLGISNGGMTKTSAFMGSPLYMCPEQMHSSKDADARSDIWALGIVLHELLSGQYPFQAQAIPELVLKIATAPAIPLRVALPSAPAGLEAVILKCLEKDPGKRYQTIGGLAVALFDFAPRRSKASVERIAGIMRRAGLSGSALELPPSSGSAAAQPQSGPLGTQASWGQTAPPASKRRRTFFLFAGLVGALGIVGGGYVLSRGHTASPVAADSALLATADPQARSRPTVAPVIPAATAAAFTPSAATTGPAGVSVPAAPPNAPALTLASPSATPPLSIVSPKRSTTVAPVGAKSHPVATGAKASHSPESKPQSPTATEPPAAAPRPSTAVPVSPLNMKIE